MEILFEKDKRNNNPIEDNIKALFKKIKNIKLPNNFYYFLILLAISFGFYMMMLVDNNFSLAYGGDYSAQYIPMGFHIWDYYHEWIQTGHFTLFDTELYLGANSFGSNAYYGLFSPFNIIIVLFPRVLVPQAVAVCSMVKLACAGLFFSTYMSKAFKVKDTIAKVCGLAYAFAGWGAFYLWYNNYQDILVFFPLVLLGLEKVLQEEKPWILALGVFFLAICNYVLMVPYLICAVFYAVFRFFQRVPLNNIKTNFRIIAFGILGGFGGLLMGLFVFAPAFMATLSSPKLDTYSYIGTLKEYLFSGQYDAFLKLLFSWGSAPDQHQRIFATRTLYPILEFFFPATTCRSLPTLELKGWDFDDIAVSLWCYVPFIMFLVPALIQSGKEKKWSIYVGFGLLLLSLFTPVMYYLTMGFTNAYARWTLFIITSLIAYVGIYIDKIPNVAKWHIHVGYAFALLGIISAWIITFALDKGEEARHGELIFRFVDGGTNFTSLAYIIELIYVTAVYLVLMFFYNKKFFHVLLMLFISLEAICMGNFVTMGHGYDTGYNNGYALNERFRSIVTEIQKKDKSFYRFYSSIGDAYSVNNSFINGYNTVAFFHSLYNFEIDDFSLWTGIRSDSRSVSGDYRGKYQDLDNLLGVKYYVTSKNKNRYAEIESNYQGGFIDNVPFDFVENKQLATDEFLVYENNSLSEFGYSYDTIYNKPMENYNRGEIDVVKNSAVLSTVAFVGEEEGQEIAEKHSDIDLMANEPVNSSIKTLTVNTDYYQYFYDLGQAAKNWALKDIPSIPSNYEPVSFVNERAMDFFVFLKSKTMGEPLFEAGTTLYARAPFSGSQKYNFNFIDEDNNVFMFDAHDDDTTDNVSYMRGFYIKKDVYTLAICGKYYQSYLGSSTLRLYEENLLNYEARRDALNADPIEKVEYSPDKFTFETHYDEEKFVVSRTAYDVGWKISAKNNNTNEDIKIETYKGNGGFVSFVAPEGDISYTMVYKTPYLGISYLVSALSITTFFVSLCGYYIYCDKKKTHYLDSLYREN